MIKFVHFGFLMSLISANHSSAAGTTQFVSDVLSDIQPDRLMLYVVLDSDKNIVSLRGTGSPEPIEVNPKDLKKGVVLLVYSGKNVAILQSSNFDLKAGGHLKLQYLYNGLSSTYRTFEFELTRIANRWLLESDDRRGRKEFNSLFLKGKKVLGQVVGIGSVTPSYKPPKPRWYQWDSVAVANP